MTLASRYDSDEDYWRPSDAYYEGNDPEEFDPPEPQWECPCSQCNGMLDDSEYLDSLEEETDEVNS